MEQQHNKGKIESFMTELGRKIDQLLDKARQGTEEAKVSDKFDELRQAKDKLERELHEFVQDDEKWREVQTHLQEAGIELRKAFETTFARKRNSNESQQSGSENWNSGTSQDSGSWNTDNPASDTTYRYTSPDTGSENRQDDADYDAPGKNPL